MNKIVKAMGLFALAAIVVLGVVGCDFVEVLTSVSGKVVNVGTTYTAEKGTDTYWLGTEGSIVTLVDTNGHTVNSATVNATGDFVFENVSAGTYTITGSKSDWAFIPVEIEVTGVFTTLNKDILAYMPANEEEILLIVNWENISIDVDSHLVLDDSEYPDGASIATIYHANSKYPSTIDPDISLDRDVMIEEGTTLNAYPVETIRIHRNPFATGDGWMRYYLKSYQYNTDLKTSTDDGVLTGNPDLAYKQRARATAYVMQGSTHMGSFPLPIDSAENTLGVIKINAVYDAGADETT